MLLKMGLELRYLSISLLACMYGAFEFFSIQRDILIVFFLDLEDVHQYHYLLFLLHVLYINNALLMAFLNFYVSASCCAVGIVKFIMSYASWPSYLSITSPTTDLSSGLVSMPESSLMHSSGTMPSK